MSRAELIARLNQAFPDIRRYEIEHAVDTVLETVVAALEQNQRIELRGFGTFTVRHRPGHSGRNPRTGVRVEIAPTHVPFFKAGKELRILLNRT